MIDWPSYNQSLVRRGQGLLDFDVLDGWTGKVTNPPASEPESTYVAKIDGTTY